MGEIDDIRKSLDYDSAIHVNDLPSPLDEIMEKDKRGYIDLQYTAGSQNIAKVESTKLCVYCNEPWTPEMEEAYLNSGYCESCFESEFKTFIACSKCRKVVYIK